LPGLQLPFSNVLNFLLMFNMGYYLFYLTLLASFLPALTAAQCAACDSYKEALKGCETTSTNVTAVGGTMDTTSLHCMCATQNNATNMNTCNGCWNSNPDLKLDVAVLLAWSTTCKADAKFGEQQAVTCWESLPGNALPCFEKGGANGGGSAPTPGATNFPTR